MQAAVVNADRPGRSPAPVCSSFNHQKDSWTFWTLGLDGSKLITLLPFWQKKPFQLNKLSTKNSLDNFYFCIYLPQLKCHGYT